MSGAFESVDYFQGCNVLSGRAFASYRRARR